MTRPRLTATPPLLPSRPAPPASLPAAGKALWRSIVATYPVDHFAGANLELLAALCQSAALVRRCDRLIAKAPFVDGKANPAVAVRDLERKAMMSLATKLRLSISSTVRAESAAARPDAKHRLPKPWEAA